MPVVRQRRRIRVLGGAGLALAVLITGAPAVSAGSPDAPAGGRSVSFQAPDLIDTGYDLVGVESGDFDGDGDLDLVTWHHVSQLSILENDGEGGFRKADAVDLDIAPTWVAVGEMNGDGDLDLVMTFDSSIYVARGGAGLTFRKARAFALPLLSDTGVLTDLDNDGDLDVAAVAARGYNKTFLLENDGHAGLSLRTVLDNGTFYSNFSIKAADLNGDGLVDLVTTPSSRDVWWNHLELLLATAPFEYTFDQVRFHRGIFALEAYDVNRDGVVDLAVTTSDYFEFEGVTVRLGRGDGTFQRRTEYAIPDASGELLAEDFDRDGRPDLALTSWGTGQLKILKGKAKGLFRPPSSFPAVTYPYNIAVGDYDGDGWSDVVVEGEYGSTVAFLRNSSR